MKFNLYIPTTREKDLWAKYAEKEGKSLAQFIREAVQEKVDYLSMIEELTDGASN